MSDPAERDSPPALDAKAEFDRHVASLADGMKSAAASFQAAQEQVSVAVEGAEEAEASRILERITSELSPLEERVQRLMHVYGL